MKDLLKAICEKHGVTHDKAELIATEQWNLIFESRILSTTEEFKNDLIRAVNIELFGDGEPDD